MYNRFDNGFDNRLYRVNNTSLQLDLSPLLLFRHITRILFSLRNTCTDLMYMHCLEMYNNVFFLHNVYAVYRYSFVAGDAFVRFTTCIRDVELFLPHDAYAWCGMLWPAVCPSHAGIVSKRIDRSSWFSAQMLPLAYPPLCFKGIRVSPSPKTRALPSGTLS